MPTIQTPDGPVDFPDNMKDADIEAVLQKQYGAPKAAAPAGAPGQTASSRLLGDHPLSDLGSVVGSHLKNLVAGPYHAFTDAPRNPEEARQMGTDANSGTISNVLGHIGLGAARMFVNPTLDSGRQAIQSAKAGSMADAANHAMDAVPIAGPWARTIENDAQQHGAIPALAGLGIDIGAPAAAGKVLGAIKDAAPSVAEGAMNIRPTARGYGKTPGQAILNETTGVRPETIERQGQAVLDQLTPQVEGMAANHKGPVSIVPAIQNVDNSIATQVARNNVSGANALGKVRDQLTENPFQLHQQFAEPFTPPADDPFDPIAPVRNGGPPNTGIAPLQTATGALNLKRGLRDQFVKNWSPDAASMLTRDAAKSASGVIDGHLDDALGPQFAQTNQRISSLIPVVDNADKLTRADPFAQRMQGKLKAHTGALTSALAGAAAGSGHGLLGSIGGAALGFALPELVGGPTASMALARGMNSPIPGAVIPALSTGGILTPKVKK